MSFLPVTKTDPTTPPSQRKAGGVGQEGQDWGIPVLVSYQRPRCTRMVAMLHAYHQAGGTRCGCLPGVLGRTMLDKAGLGEAWFDVVEHVYHDMVSTSEDRVRDALQIRCYIFVAGSCRPFISVTSPRGLLQTRHAKEIGPGSASTSATGSHTSPPSPFSFPVNLTLSDSPPPHLPK